jgi:biopolymer transport protein ExbB
MGIERINRITDYGSAWVLWVLIIASVVALAIVLERLVLFMSSRDNVPRLRREVRALLEREDVAGARKRLDESPSFEAAIALAGLDARGAASAEERIHAEQQVARLSLERNLGFLGTLGSNAPFVGLLGTVIGIVQAFEQLQVAGAANGSGGAMNGVMGAIAEALVATAIGLVVAIPAVAAFNAFQRRIKGILGNAEALRHVVLSYVKSTSPQRSTSPTAHELDDSHVVPFEQRAAFAK